MVAALSVRTYSVLAPADEARKEGRRLEAPGRIRPKHPAGNVFGLNSSSQEG